MNYKEGNPENRIFDILSILHRSTLLFMKREMKQSGIECLPPYLLLIGSFEGLSQDELAAQMKIDKGAVAKTVKSMEQNGYILRRQDEKDRRRKGLYLTDKGRAALPVIRAQKKSYEVVLTAGMSEAEKEQFYLLAQRAAANLVHSLSAEDDLKGGAIL